MKLLFDQNISFRIYLSNFIVMKFNSPVIFLFFFGCFISGCKYEDGPGISFRSACARVEGTYDIVKFEVGGADSTLSIISQSCYGKIKLDGGEEHDIIFTGLPVTCRTSGFWDLTNNNNDLTLEFDGKFVGIPPFGNGGGIEPVSAKYKILRLKDDEIKITTTYNNLTYLIELAE